MPFIYGRNVSTITPPEQLDISSATICSVKRTQGKTHTLVMNGFATPAASRSIDDLDDQIQIVTEALVQTRALKDSQLNGHLPNNSHPLVLAIYMQSQNSGINLAAYRKALSREIYHLIEEKRRFTQSLELGQRFVNQVPGPLFASPGGPLSTVPTMVFPPGYREIDGHSIAHDGRRQSSSRDY
ncbi:hypothetical protein BGZ83_009611 [Gryganskiella cystojenkinii]|nr:hypothetical protein BGZ83_009611 [Gryganskiella cystojenkinii]